MWKYSTVTRPSPNTRPSPDTLAVWSALLVAHRRLTVELDGELRRDGAMTLDEYDVLYQVRLGPGPLRMTDLADRVLISRPSASRLVERLVGRGWLDRWHDDADRRVVLLSLTRDGRRAQGRAAAVHLAGIERLVGVPLAGHDVASLAAALRSLGR